jgi:hypothetical protein
MNIFVLDKNPVMAAKCHLDKHIVKMVCEYSQLLSSAHRVLDGTLKILDLANKKQKILVLEGEELQLNYPIGKDKNNKILYGIKERPNTLSRNKKYVIVNLRCNAASHENHPCAIWARESVANYCWLFELFKETAKEYTHRYGKTHKSWSDYNSFLHNPPKNIVHKEQTPFALAMPDQYKVSDAVISYQNFYLGSKIRFAKWTNSEVPEWFRNGLSPDADIASFQRTR